MSLHKISVCNFVAALLCLTIAIGFAQAETLKVSVAYAEGMAAIVDGDRDKARHSALEDALIQASLVMGARVMSTERISAGAAPLQSLKIRPTQRVAGYSVLREWEDQGIYHVAVSAEGYEKGSLANIPTVKKKISFTQFDVANTLQVDDIKNIFDGLPIELSRRLNTGEGFLANYVSGTIPRDSVALQQEAVMRISREVGAQFLVSGWVLDAGIKREDGFLGTPIGRKNRRHFKIEIAIHDGLTGVRLLRDSLDEEAQGEVQIGNDKPFGSGGFYGTESGRAIDRLIDAVTKKISATLACLPFSTHVVRLEGKNVYLDAGETSMLKVGDKLVLYSNDFHPPIVGAGGAALGIPERPMTTVTLIKIQPMFSIGELPEDAIKHGIKAGGIARLEYTDIDLGPSDCLQ